MPRSGKRNIVAKVDREHILQHELQARLAQRLVPGTDAFPAEALEALDAYAQTDEADADIEKAPLLVGAPAGAGKSSLAAHWLKTLLEQSHAANEADEGGNDDDEGNGDDDRGQTLATDANKHEKVIRAFFVGSSASSQRLVLLLHEIIVNLVDSLQLEATELPTDQTSLESIFAEVLQNAAKVAQSIIILVDAIDKLEDERGRPATLDWLPKALPPNIRIVLFARVEDPRPFTGAAPHPARVEESEHENDDEEEEGENEDGSKRSDDEAKEMDAEHGGSKSSAPAVGAVQVLSSSSFSPRPASERLGTYSDIDVQHAYSDVSDSEASMATAARNRDVEFVHFDNCITEHRATEIVRAFIKWTAQQALQAQSAANTAPGDADRIAETTLPRPLSLLGAHVGQLAVFAAQANSLAALFVALRGIHLAAHLDYDVHDLVKKVCAIQRNRASGVVSAVVETLMHFFARGNYPTRISVTAAWETAQQSSCISETVRPASADKKPLPSPRELAQWRELHSILTTGQGMVDEAEDLSGEEEGEDDDAGYSDDDFEEEASPQQAQTAPAGKACETQASSGDLDETLREMLKFPVHLLGGCKREPLGDWLYKGLGYICSSRYGLSLSELCDTLDEACRKDIEASEDTNSFPEPALKMAEDSLEDWLLNETMPEEDEPAPPASVVPESVKEQLEAVLPCFTLVTSGSLFSVVPADRFTHLAVSRVVLTSPDYAPTESHVEKIHRTLERRLYGKLKSEYDEEASFYESASPPAPAPEASSQSPRRPKKRPCEEDYSRRDSCDREMASLPARWRLILLQVLSVKRKSAFIETRPTEDQRFCEEYPWLLAANGRWVGLLDAVADLRTFRALWDGTPVLRHDLLQYWQELSSSAALPRDGTDEDDDGEDDVIFGAGATPSKASFGQPGVLGPSESLLGQSLGLAPPQGPGEEVLPPVRCWIKCDPVEHYTRAVELEQGRARGNIDRVRGLANAIMEICEFLYAFGQFEVSAPDYLHPPLRESRVAGLQVELPHGGASTSDAASKNRHVREHGWTLDVESTRVKLDIAKAARDEMMNEQHLAQRTQAVSQVSDADEKHVLLSLQRKQSQFFRFRIEQQARFQAKSAAQRASEGDRFRGNKFGENFYSYQRWVWIHFPWMALYHAYAALANAGGPADIEAPVLPADVFWLRKKKDPRSDRPPPPKRITKAKIVLPASLTQSTPSLPSLGSPTALALRPGSGGDPGLLQQGCGPSHRVAQRLPPNEVPYSSPSVRTLRHGTRFPTFEMMQRERPSTDKLAFFNGGFVDPDVIKAAQEGRVLRAAKCKPDQRDAGSVLAQMRASLPAHLRSYPTTEQEARVAEMNGMLAGFRKTLDDLHFEANRKEDDLEALMQQVYERIELDRYTEACIRDGEESIALLTDNLSSTTHAIAREDTVHACLKRIVKVCDKYPAHDEKHVLELEALVESMREDRISLTKDLDEVNLFLRRAREQDQPMLENALNMRRDKHQEILNKLFQWRENERRSRRIKQEREAHRRAIIASTQAEPLTYEMTQRRWKEAHRQKLIEEILEGDLDADQHARALAIKRHKAFRKLRKLAGSSDVQEICIKFKDSCQKTDDLLVRRREAFRQIKHLKTRLEEMQKEKQHICKRKASKSVTLGLKLEEVSKQCEAAEERLRVARENQLTSEALVEQIKISLSQYRRGPEACGVEDDHLASRSAEAAHAQVEALLVRCAGAVGIADFRSNVTVDAVRTKVRAQRKLSNAEVKKRQEFLFSAVNKKPVALPPRISVDIHRSMRKPRHGGGNNTTTNNNNNNNNNSANQE